jgi:nucleotide-binding universal stress UspA family protein
MQLRKVVVGIDFTDASLGAATWVASRIAPEADIVLVHVTPSPSLPRFLQPHLPLPADLALTSATALDGGLRALADLVARDRGRAELVSGSPADALALVAEETDADLICVGRGKRRHGSARFGATTPQRLLTRTQVPTLVVPTGRLESATRVIACVDDRLGGRDVFDVACRLARGVDARVEALHIIEPEILRFVSATREALGMIDEPCTCHAQPPVAGDVRRLHRDWLRERAREWLDGILDHLQVSASRAASVIQCGDAGEEIIRHARGSCADLIVVGRGGDASHAQGRASALPLGSTARLVLWAAPCPVLVLPLDGSHSVMPPPFDGERWRRQNTKASTRRNAARAHSGPLPPAAQQRRPVNGSGAA